MTNGVMLTIRSRERAPTVAEIKSKYGLTSDDIDESFGVVHIDPNDDLYTILVDSSAAKKVHPDQDWEIEGPFSNPKIEPFGPPEH